MLIIAGLGNPDKKYEHTRHNTGFEVLDILSDRWDIKINDKKHRSLCGTGIIRGEKILLMKPQTYMNCSGEAIADAVGFYKVDPAADLIIIYDDVDLPVGRLRIRAEGSAGGHNGMKDIISHLGSEAFTRVRVGIGARPADWDMADWVLSRFSDDDESVMKKSRLLAAEAVDDIVSNGVDHAMSGYNASDTASAGQ